MAKTWQASPVLGVRQVRRTAEYYRDVLGFSLDPDGVFQPSADEPDGVYGIVKRPGAWIHFQIRRDEVPARQRPAFERDVYLYVDDVDDLYADLRRRGARIQAPPQMAPHGIREIVVEVSMGIDSHSASCHGSSSTMSQQASNNSMQRTALRAAADAER